MNRSLTPEMAPLYSSAPSDITDSEWPADDALGARLAPPPLPAGVVLRAPLLTRLGQVWRHPLTLVSAPAGFGKTTLLAAWAAEFGKAALPTPPHGDLAAHLSAPSPRHLAWLTLEAAHNDPAQFWRALVAALRVPHPGVGGQLLGVNLSAPPERIVAALLPDLAALPGETALVLDDYHLIANPAVHHGLLALIERAPGRLRLVVAGRSDPPLAIARLRAYGQLLELRAHDLRFSGDEAARLLNDVLGLHVAASEAHALAERTEGWVAGLQLAALGLGASADRAAFVIGFDGSDRYVADYLLEEVTARQPAAVQEFLLRTAILARLNDALCAAVADTPDAAALLEQVERANLFLIPLDTTRQWFRYHRLFAEALRHRLAHSRPELLPALHRRAGEWYAENGLPGEAVEHAFAAGDLAWAADLLERAAETVVARGDVRTVERWLAALPEPILRARPRLALMRAVALVAHGQLQAAEAWLDGAAADADPMTREAITGVRLFIVRMRGDATRSAELTHQALAELPPESAHLRGIVTVNLGGIYQLTGDLAGAARTIAEGIVIAQGVQHELLEPLRPALAPPGGVMRPDWAQRYAPVIAVLTAPAAQAPAAKGPPVRAIGLIGLAEVLYEWNALHLAEQALRFSLDLAQQAHPMHAEVLVRGTGLLARIHAARGEWETALVLLEGVEHGGDVCAPALLQYAALQRARLWLRRGDIVRAADWTHARWPQAGEFSELYQLEHTTFVRLLLAQGETESALALLATLRRGAAEAGRTADLIEVGVLQALAHQARGDSAQALAALDVAVTLAEPGGYVRTFLDEGEPLLTLLRRGAARGASRAPTRAYASWLLDQRAEAAGASATHEPTLPRLVEPLSARELGVLELLLTGASNQEIARRLVITSGTVKRHIHSIYGKLNAHNRVELVARARELRLLTA